MAIPALNVGVQPPTNTHGNPSDPRDALAGGTGGATVTNAALSGTNLILTKSDSSTVSADLSPLGGGPGSDTTAARATDYRFYGIERVDLKARYSARCDGTSHPLSGLYGSLALAQAAYPNAGLTSGTWAATEVDTAAWLQAEYDLRAGGGIIGLADGAGLMASQTLWLQQAGLVAFHGGRNTRVYGEACGTSPVLRASNTSANASNTATGPAQPMPFRDITLLAWNAGRFGFSAAPGVAAPGYANAAARGSNTDGYRTGSCAIQIDDGGAAGQSSGLSGPASVYATFFGLRWINFDDAIRWGDNTFAIKFLDCSGENNNKGFSWAQTTGLNSMERIVFEGGSLSNNNYGTYIDARFPGNAQGQGGSFFINGTSIDYNLVSQGTIYLADSDLVDSQSSVHITRCHIENKAEVIGPSEWFTVQGAVTFDDNQIYINTRNGVATRGLVSASDNSAISLVSNTIAGTAPLVTSTTSNSKAIHAVGNIMNPTNGASVVALRDLNGSAIQPAITDMPPADWYQDNLVLTAAVYGNQSSIWVTGSCTKITLPANNADSIRVGKEFLVHNTSSNPVYIQVPVGIFFAGMGNYTDNKNGTNTVVAGTPIPANSTTTLKHRSATDWVMQGAYTASASS